MSRKLFKSNQMSVFVIVGMTFLLIVLAMSCDGKSGRTNSQTLPSQNQVAENDDSAGCNTDSDIQVDIVQRELPPLENVLREIDELPANGIDPETLKECKVELATQLAMKYIGEGQRTRTMSTPPDFNYGKVTNAWYDAESGIIFWEYSNRGDYNLDGEVNVQDLTEFVEYFGRSVGDGTGDEAKKDWLDGDRDGVIGLGDITVLANNFLSSVKGYRVYGANEDGGKRTLLGIVEFDANAKSYPPIMQLTPVLPLNDPKAIWPSPYVVFQAYDFSGARGDLLGYVKLNDIAYSVGVYPSKYQGGETGRIISISITSAYNLLVGEDEFQLSWPNITTNLTWDFGEGAEILYEDPFYVTVRLGEPGLYDCTLTADNCYGSYVDEFNLIVLDRIQPDMDSVWLDTYNTPGTSNLNIDAYACRITDPFGISMLRIAFDTGGLFPAGNSMQYGSISDGLWRYLDPAVAKPSSVSAVRLEDRELCIYMNAFTNPTASSTSSAGLGSLELYNFPTPSIRPASVKLLNFDRTFPAVRDSGKITKFDGNFEWQNFDSAPHSALGYGVYYGGITGRDMIIKENANGKPVITFAPGIPGDYNGDYVIDMLDISAIGIRYEELTDDGVFDAYDIQCDGDMSGEVGLPDITVIATDFLSGVSVFRLYRDDVVLGEFHVQSPKQLTEPIELWDEFTFTDEEAPLGEHLYHYSAYDPEFGLENFGDKYAYFTVE